MPAPPVDTLKYALTRYDQQIELELNLIGARMTWLAISQSFLFGAFVGGGNLQPYAFGAGVQALVSVVGLLICVWVRTGVQAALHVVDVRKDQRQPVLEALSSELGIALPAVNRTDREHKGGNAPPRMIPTMLILAWAGLILMWGGRVIDALRG
jgi:hypothetical protein